MTARRRDIAATSRDRDGWLVNAKTGALIGPDPDIERELTDAELEQTRPLGRPRLPEGERREQITLRWSRATIDALKARGPGYTNFAEEAVKRALKNVDVFGVTDTARRYVEAKMPAKVTKRLEAAIDAAFPSVPLERRQAMARLFAEMGPSFGLGRLFQNTVGAAKSKKKRAAKRAVAHPARDRSASKH